METYNLVTNMTPEGKFTTLRKLFDAVEFGYMELLIDRRYDPETGHTYGEYLIFKNLEGQVVFMCYLRYGAWINYDKPVQLRYKIYKLGIPADLFNN